MANHSAGKKFIKNFGSLFLVQIANYLLPMFSMPIISRIIGPEKFGIISYSSAIINYFMLFVSFGFDLSATRIIAINRDDKKLINEVFSKVFWARCMLLAVSSIIFITLLLFDEGTAEEKIVLIFTFLLVFSTVITPNFLFQGMQDLHRSALFNFIVKILSTALIILLIKKRSDFIFQPLVLGVAQLCVGVAAFYIAVKRYKITLIKIKFKSLWDNIWQDKTMFFSMVVMNLYTNTNVVLLGFFASKTEIGYYSASVRMVSIVLSLINIPLNQTLFPMIGQAFGKSTEEGIEKAKRIIPLVFYITFLISISLIIGSKFVIDIFYGQSFSKAILIFEIIALVPCIAAMSNLIGVQIMLNLRMDKLFFQVTSLGAVFSLCLNVLIVKRWGSVGSAICLVSSEAFITIYMYYLFTSKTKSRLIELKYFTFSSIKSSVKSFLVKR